jgi:hypothetical protein
MVVMSRTTQLKRAAGKVPASVWVAKSRHIGGVEDDAHSISEKIGSGRAFLKVVAYSWGVEFDLCEEEQGA